MSPAPSRPTTRRRGLTLVEMLVTVALLLIIMTIIVSIFQAATVAMTGAQVDQELAQVLRRFDATIRQDLDGATARFTPPVDPKDGRGYFEYSEGALSDKQGEDSDDTIALTVKAPEGQPFTGRMVLQVPGTTGNGTQFRQVTITSQFAEVLYFLRGDNLYRRVLLIVPEQAGLVVGRQAGGGFSNTNWYPDYLSFPFGTQVVSWQGMNDISAHASPADTIAITPTPTALPATYVPVPNTLSDLTNREYRIYRPRFANDYVRFDPISNTFILWPDGSPDDEDNNGVPDYYPTLYPHAFSNMVNYTYPNGRTVPPFPLINAAASRFRTPDTLPFPFLFPGAYSKSDPRPDPYDPAKPGPFDSVNFGKIHGLDPTGATFNHSPLDVGDSLPVPNPSNADQLQTWWAFPTWRETLSPFWTSPVKRINDPDNQAAQAVYYGTFKIPPRNPNDTAYVQAPGLSRVSPRALPPVSSDDQPFNDGSGDQSANGFDLGSTGYQDDILMTGVRSFDVKAYDPNASIYGVAIRPNYYDLGYAEQIKGFASEAAAKSALTGFGHEGRIPPLSADFRADARGGLPSLGDDAVDVVRLRRVWDSWSTVYTNAPDSGINPATGLPTGVAVGDRPIYPSYPAPYPAALRGIQIQVRVVDPRNERLKVLTIRHDFTDKL
jgi:prepilin-type N-terminal cleavage/methylation domain-containing protein